MRGESKVSWKEDIEMLSERECEIIELVKMGYTNNEIAHTLFISSRTVEKHREIICSKLGLKGRRSLFKWCNL